MSEAPSGRLQSLDIVRGVAVMGILLLNIVGFAMPDAAYFNPRAYGGSTGLDLAAYLVNFLFFDGRMRGLFSFLFGASMLLVNEQAEAKGESPAKVHFSRMAWLLVFGLAHLYLVWEGDILAHYALVGMFAFLLRRAPVPRLLGLGVTLLFVQLLLLAGVPLGVLAAEHAAPGTSAAQELAGFNRQFGLPGAAEISRELDLHRSGYAAIAAGRAHENASGPLPLLISYGAETLAYMLFGMAALRSGMLAGQWSRTRYRRWLSVGFGIGVPIYALLAAYMVHRNFDLFSVTFSVLAASTLVRPLMILGWIALILLLARPGGTLTSRVAAAGRMAFSNYIATSLICTTLFYGYGLGWYGDLSRAELYVVVAAIWALMLLWSQPWLARFRYGPLEWLWRSLARRRLQPIRGSANDTH